MPTDGSTSADLIMGPTILFLALFALNMKIVLRGPLRTDKNGRHLPFPFAKFNNAKEMHHSELEIDFKYCD